MGLERGFEGVIPPLGLLILSRLNTTLTIGVEFLAIGAKTILAQGLPYFSH
jgi:hypothetical protein